LRSNPEYYYQTLIPSLRGTKASKALRFVTNRFALGQNGSNPGLSHQFLNNEDI
jgi:hypothetical protein